MPETTPEPQGVYFAWYAQDRPPLWDIAQCVREHPDWRLFRLLEDENDFEQIVLAPSHEDAKQVRMDSIIGESFPFPVTDQPW